MPYVMNIRGQTWRWSMNQNAVECCCQVPRLRYAAADDFGRTSGQIEWQQHGRWHALVFGEGFRGTVGCLGCGCAVEVHEITRPHETEVSPAARTDAPRGAAGSCGLEGLVLVGTQERSETYA